MLARCELHGHFLCPAGQFFFENGGSLETLQLTKRFWSFGLPLRAAQSRVQPNHGGREVLRCGCRHVSRDAVQHSGRRPATQRLARLV